MKKIVIETGKNGEVRLPKEVIAKLDIKYKDPLEVYDDSCAVVLLNFEPMGEFDKLLETRSYE